MELGDRFIIDSSLTELQRDERSCKMAKSNPFFSDRELVSEYGSLDWDETEM
jgi:hypothetical protein